MTQAHGPVVVRRRLGAGLKRLRAGLDLRLDVVARRMEMSPSKLSRLETGQVAPRIRDVRDLLEIYEAPGDVRDRMMQWANEAKQPGWWQPFSNAIDADLDLYISLESEARRIRMFSMQVSGLLQTEDYARMLLTGAAPNCSSGDLERLVQIRITRQNVLDPRGDAGPLLLHVILDELALRRGIPGPAMREQLAELLRRSELPHVVLQVLPFDAGFVEASSTFAIFEPREESDGTVVNVESTGQDAYFDTAGDVAKYDAIWGRIVASALDPERSRDLISRLSAESVRPG